MWRARQFAHIAFVSAAVLLSVAHVPLAYPVDDPFQEAEYVIWGHGGGGAPPVLIHGGLDVLPSRAAAAMCSAEHTIVCVRAINAGLQGVALALLMAVALLLGGVGTGAALLATLPVLLLVAGVNGAHGSPVDAHQGTPGIRDLTVLGGLLLMVLAARRPRAWLLVLIGALAALAPFWAYNRGLAQGVVTGLFVLAVCMLRRSARPLLAAAAGAVVALGVLVAVIGLPSVLGAVGDIVYWLRNAGLWRTEGGLRVMLVTVAVHGIGLAFGAVAAWEAWRAGRRGTVAVAAILAATGALYLMSSLNRPDAVHLRWTLWPPALLMAMGIAALRPGIARRAPAAAAIVLMALAAIQLADPMPGRWTFLPGLRANAALLSQPWPTDRDLSGEELVRVADRVRAAGGCVFAADNAALVHLLSGAPRCSRFGFGAYIARSEQQAVIAELQAAGPATILWHHPAWWSNIDRRTFRQNTPELAAWIEAAYPVQTTIGQHVLRTRD